MSSQHDITKKPTATSASADCEPQPENTARATRACDDDYPDRITHHNERPARDRPADQPEPQTDPAPEEEPDQLTTYDPAGEIPFSNWDGEEGQPPHN